MREHSRMITLISMLSTRRYSWIENSSIVPLDQMWHKKIKGILSSKRRTNWNLLKMRDSKCQIHLSNTRYSRRTDFPSRIDWKVMKGCMNNVKTAIQEIRRKRRTRTRKRKVCLLLDSITRRTRRIYRIRMYNLSRKAHMDQFSRIIRLVGVSNEAEVAVKFWKQSNRLHSHRFQFHPEIMINNN